MLENIVKLLSGLVDVPVRPYGIDVMDEAVCYSLTPISDDGAVATARLELRLITRTVAKAEELKKLINSALVTIADNPKNGYNACYLNGGGNLWDDNTKLSHMILYYYITTKSEVSYNG